MRFLINVFLTILVLVLLGHLLQRAEALHVDVRWFIFFTLNITESMNVYCANTAPTELQLILFRLQHASPFEVFLDLVYILWRSCYSLKALIKSRTDY